MTSRKRERLEQTSHKVIEKRRRDRINNCLLELSQTVPAAFSKQSSGKLEKAEILEMTVEYLRAVQSTEIGIRFDNGEWFSTDIWSDFAQHYQTGYSECVREVVKYMADVEGIALGDARCARLVAFLHNRFRSDPALSASAILAAGSATTCGSQSTGSGNGSGVGNGNGGGLFFDRSIPRSVMSPYSGALAHVVHSVGARTTVGGLAWTGVTSSSEASARPVLTASHTAKGPASRAEGLAIAVATGTEASSASDSGRGRPHTAPYTATHFAPTSLALDSPAHLRPPLPYPPSHSSSSLIPTPLPVPLGLTPTTIHVSPLRPVPHLPFPAVDMGGRLTSDLPLSSAFVPPQLGPRPLRPLAPAGGYLADAGGMGRKELLCPAAS